MCRFRFFNEFRRIVLFVIMVQSLVACVNTPPATATPKPKPCLYNIKHLDELKEKGDNDSIIAEFLRKADRMTKSPVLTVLGKEHSFSENPHDYCSVPPYSWPDENNPEGPYVTKDGITNPLRLKYDRPKLDQLASRLQYLSVALYLTDDEKYYSAFINNIKAWCLNSLTYMTPNMEYAQVMQGRNNNKGQSYGLVELTKFTPILESIFLVNSVHTIDKSTYNELIKWFESLLNWTLQSEQWKETKKTKNNIISGCYVVIVEMARLTGNRKLARQMGKEYTSKVLDVQLEDDGRQPAELRRTNAFAYSVGNLKNIVDFALIMEKNGVKYYKRNQKKIDKAFHYLSQFVDNHDAFPYQQKNNWEPYENMHKANLLRLGRLSSNKSSLANKQVRLSPEAPNDVLEYVY